MKTAICIFDLDGTLLNTLSAISYYGNATLTHFGLKPYPADRYRYFAGRGAKNLVENMLKAQDAYTEDFFQEVFAYYNALYNANPTKDTAPYEEIPALLSALAKADVRFAVLSNKPHYAVAETVKGFFPNFSFAYVQGQTEDLPLKPSPEGIYRILDAFSIPKEACLYIGDSDVDMFTAKAAGVFSVGASWGFRGEKELFEAGASAVAKTPLDILQYLKKE